MIHKYFLNGLYIVLDVNSGAVHIVDELVYDVLDYYKEMSPEDIAQKLPKYSKEEILECCEELAELEKDGQLYSEDIYEQVVPKIERRSPVVKALCLHIAHDCNLKCEYCFAEEGEYHGKRELMSLEVGKKAIDFLIKASGKRKNLEVDFFGGEPLMNFEVVKDIVKYARSIEKEHDKNFRFTITTNGMLLNDKNMEFINENMHNVVLSIDGRKEVHDRMRPTASGKGSYDIVLPKFKKMAESRNQTDYYVRGTFTHYNLDFGKDILSMADNGFKQISVEPVVADESMPYAIKEEDLPRLYEEYEALASEMLKRRGTDKDFNFFHFMIDLTGGPCLMKRLVGCGSGTEYLAVAPSGDLYPCHQFVGMEQFKMGDVDSGVVRDDIRCDFENCNVYNKPVCKECWAKNYCSGGCVANSYNTHGDLVTPYETGCKLQKKRIECAIMLKATQSEQQ